ncbi:Putative zinc- or iron-chelating domain protein [Candidatus Tiddalikarchaeum anstoanum]|nr:Putative zinc- or iron-chelating domain protein [Candidatus Tiddalikarchaeum anstoanum]
MMFVCRYKECKAKCCRELRSAIMSYDYSLDEKRHIHLLVPANKATIGLSLEEKEKLEERAKELGIKLIINPLKAVITKDDEPVIIKWFIDHDSCPFLKKDYSCSIYDDRPMICRAFPLIPIINDINKRIICKSDFCPHTKDIIVKDDADYKTEFKECYPSYSEVRNFNDDLERKIKELVNKGLIKRMQMRAAIRIFENYGSRIKSFDEYYYETVN